MNWLQGVLFAVYAVSVHVFAATAKISAAMVAVGALATAVLVPAVRARRRWLVGAVLAGAITVILAGAEVIASVVLTALPVCVNAGLAWLFGHTLVAGRDPLVSRLVRLLHPANDIRDEAVWPYARRVTVVWTVLFCVNATICLVLGLLAVPGGVFAAIGLHTPLRVPLQWWSWFANLGCYTLSGGLFVVEYAYRRRKFPWQPYRNFVDFCVQAARVAPALMMDLRRDPRVRAA